MPRRCLRRSSSARTASAKPTLACGDAARLGVGRRELGLRVADRRRGELAGPTARLNGGGSARRAERAEVEVVGDLDDQLVEVLDQLGAGVGVAGDAERAQHQLAELVGGRDRGAVEVGERVADPPVAQGDSSSSPSRGGRAVRRPGRTVAGSASARSASTSCARTRSRSSWLAARPKVMTSISSSVATPSAT